MSNKKSIDDAMQFVNTERGHFILSQALFLALQSMEKRPSEKREYANEADMKFLLKNLFMIYPAIEEIKARQAGGVNAR